MFFLYISCILWIFLLIALWFSWTCHWCSLKTHFICFQNIKWTVNQLEIGATLASNFILLIKTKQNYFLSTVKITYFFVTAITWDRNHIHHEKKRIKWVKFDWICTRIPCFSSTWLLRNFISMYASCQITLHLKHCIQFMCIATTAKMFPCSKFYISFLVQSFRLKYRKWMHIKSKIRTAPNTDGYQFIKIPLTWSKPSIIPSRMLF